MLGGTEELYTAGGYEGKGPITRLLLKLGTTQDESPPYTLNAPIWEARYSKSMAHLPFWTELKDGMEANQILKGSFEDFTEHSFCWGLIRPVVSRITMKEYVVMGATSAAVRMNFTSLAAGSDELMNLKTSIAKSVEPTAARGTDLTREIACSNSSDRNSVVSLDKATTTREKGMTDIESPRKQGASGNNQSTDAHNQETLERMKTESMISKKESQGTRCQINQGNGIKYLSPRKAISKMQRKMRKVMGYLAKPTTCLAKITRNEKAVETTSRLNDRQAKAWGDSPRQEGNGLTIIGDTKRADNTAVMRPCDNTLQAIEGTGKEHRNRDTNHNQSETWDVDMVEEKGKSQVDWSKVSKEESTAT